VTVVYDGDCGVCSAAVALARERAPRGGVAFTASQSLSDAQRAAIEARAGAGVFDRSIVLDGAGRTLTGARAVNATLALLFPRSAPYVAVVERIAPLVALEDAGYRFFARHRRAISRALGLTACATR
jgi:predicted DCC family thiol-disulfide oxidoreductase YuxK